MKNKKTAIIKILLFIGTIGMVFGLSSKGLPDYLKLYIGNNTGEKLFVKTLYNQELLGTDNPNTKDKNDYWRNVFFARTIIGELNNVENNPKYFLDNMPFIVDKLHSKDYYHSNDERYRMAIFQYFMGGFYRYPRSVPFLLFFKREGELKVGHMSDKLRALSPREKFDLIFKDYEIFDEYGRILFRKEDVNDKIKFGKKEGFIVNEMPRKLDKLENYSYGEYDYFTLEKKNIQPRYKYFRVYKMNNQSNETVYVSMRPKKTFKREEYRRPEPYLMVAHDYEKEEKSLLHLFYLTAYQGKYTDAQKYRINIFDSGWFEEVEFHGKGWEEFMKRSEAHNKPLPFGGKEYPIPLPIEPQEEVWLAVMNYDSDILAGKGDADQFKEFVKDIHVYVGKGEAEREIMNLNDITDDSFTQDTEHDFMEYLNITDKDIVRK